MVFTTGTLPTGVISGNIYSINKNNGQIAVTFIDSVVPISKGGTGAITASAARTNLGIVSLPTVNSSDNGKVMTVVNGEWSAAAGVSPSSYESLDNKPSINSVMLSGNKTSNDLGLAFASDVLSKADKVSSATNGNFASLDANGNLTDSGHKHSDYLTSHQDISGKQDKTDSSLTTTAQTVVGAINENNTAIAKLGVYTMSSSQELLTVARDTTICPENTVRWINPRNGTVSGGATQYGMACVTKRYNTAISVRIYSDYGTEYFNYWDNTNEVWVGWDTVAKNSAVSIQSQARAKLPNVDILSTSIEPGLYYVTNGTNTPTTGASGYLDVTTRVDTPTTIRTVRWRPYNSYDEYINLLPNSGTWSGWQTLALNSNAYYKTGDTLTLSGFQTTFRSLVDKSGIFMRICLDKPISASGINVSITSNSPTYSSYNIGNITTTSTIGNKAAAAHYIQFSATTSNTISTNEANGVVELNATITFT